MLRVGILLSGSGRTLQNLIDRSRSGRLPITIEGVVASRPDVMGLERAAEAGIASHVVDARRVPEPQFSHEITAYMTEAEVDLVCMCGFVHFWQIPTVFQWRVMNIHPALLPKFGGHGFYGQRVHQAVLESGDTESGCTVHFADNEYDHGPIILQKRVPVRPDDTPATLAVRVFEAECEAYPEAIELFAAGRLRVEEDRVVIENP